MSLSQDKILPPITTGKYSNKITQDNNIFQIINELKKSIKKIKSIIPNNITIEIEEKINTYFLKINTFIDIFTDSINSYFSQNEALLRKDEQSLRILYGKFFNQRLINEVLENKINILNKKEKEYELLKQKTGAIICNGKVICNERKDNEIIILRTENSLLKNAIKNNEDLLKEKNEMINSLNNDILLYKNQIDELTKAKNGKYSSFSSINININEPKKDIIHKKIKSNNRNNINNSFIKTFQVFATKKNNSLQNQILNNINNNSINNIYSSYQKNSQLINRVTNSKNKNNNKEKEFQNNNVSNKNETIDSSKTYSIKYISVNKSLFSPKNNKRPKGEFNNSNNIENKTLQINRIKKSNYILNNNSLSNREFKTITIGVNKDNQTKFKKTLINNKLLLKHRKSNSIQWPEKSIKRFIRGRKDNNNLSIENENSHMHSITKKFSKNKSHNKNKTLPSSILKSLADGFRKKNQTYSQKSLTFYLMPYADRKNDNRGRNDNFSRICKDYNKDNSLSFLQKSFMNRTSCDNYYNSEKNFNLIYNNSVEISRNNNPNLKNKI